MNTLFDIPESMPLISSFTCRQCAHNEAWECGSKVIHYCRVRKSKRTTNGLLKIKCKDNACLTFKNIEI
jgi:hypothetical protein